MRKHNPRHLRICIPDPRSVDELGLIGIDDSMLNVPSFGRALCYLALLASLALAVVVYGITWTNGTSLTDFGYGKGTSLWSRPGHDGNSTNAPGASNNELPAGVHPISHLMGIATKQFSKLRANEIQTLGQAAAQYRKLRGRHPPPGFHTWYKYAKTHDAIINEKFWDQIYHDLAPFWGLKPIGLRKKAHVLSPRIAIRNGSVDVHTLNQHHKLEIWREMLSALAGDPKVNLPDIDIPLNTASEPSMLVPWESIDTALSVARKIMPEPSATISTFSGLNDIESLAAGYDWKPEWLGPRLNYPASHLGPRPLWSLIRPACPPKSPARLAHIYNDIWDSRVPTKAEHEATALLPSDFPGGSLKGYVKHWTQATDVCHHPHLQGLHSALVSPVNMAIATKLFPLFGSVKIGMGNEILLPGAEDWNTTRSRDGEAIEWDEEENKLYWRGESTRAREPQRYWRRFQRERAMSMLNASHVGEAVNEMLSGNLSKTGVALARNFILVPANPYALKSQNDGKSAEWVNTWANAAFTTLDCANTDDEQDGCEKYFSFTSPYQAKEEAKARFAISLDDKSLTGHLRNGKVTLRTSVYRQWYDARLVPWLHYIPLDSTLVDLYGVMEFFVGYHTKEKVDGGNDARLSNRFAHEEEAHRIAEGSKDWANKVLRREDMLIYVYRLLLEYARVVDDRRDRLGWVGDLR
jgi:hypothetical protein